jgi:hypothetical protein
MNNYSINFSSHIGMIITEEEQPQPVVSRVTTTRSDSSYQFIDDDLDVAAE